MFESQAMDFMSGGMSEDEQSGFKKFLEENDEYQKKYNELGDTWKKIGAMNSPEPSSKMDEAFFEMLSNEIDKTNKETVEGTFLEKLIGLFRPQFAYGILLLGIGLAIGYYVNSDTSIDGAGVVVSNEATAEVRQRLVLTLLEQPSANQRLQGVSEANKFENVDEMVIKALLQTLNNDSNVNVRLAAIESLTNYVNDPLVRQGLVQSIPNQESPILQVTLANLMVALQEKASIEPFKQLLKEKELDTTVQKKIKNSIESII